MDGPAGSGKTTLADQVSGLSGAPVVHLDDLYDGWNGLSRLGEQLDGVLLPLAAGRPGTYRRYDWDEGRYAETVTVPAVPLLVLEGVGAGSLRHAALVTMLAFVVVAAELRLQRGLERDGTEMAGHWRRWMRSEADHLAEQRTRARADLLVDGRSLLG